MPLVPERWHLYVAALDPRVGTKPGKQPPCLAIQPTEFGRAGLPSTVVLPLTTNVVRADAFPLRVRIPAGVCGLTRDSDILVDQILAWDNEFFRRYPCPPLRTLRTQRPQVPRWILVPALRTEHGSGVFQIDRSTVTLRVVGQAMSSPSCLDLRY